MKKIIISLYCIILCSVYGKAQTAWNSTTAYQSPTQVTKVIGGTTYTFDCTASSPTYTDPSIAGNNWAWTVHYSGTTQPVLAGGFTYSAGAKVSAIVNGTSYIFDCIANNAADPQLSSSNWAWNVDYSGTIQPILVGYKYLVGAKVSAILSNNSNYVFECLQINTIDPKSNANGYAWAITNDLILPWVDYHYKTIDTKVTYNGQSYSLVKETQVGNSPLTNAVYWKIDNEWSASCSNYIAGNEVWKKIGTTVYYFTALKTGTGFDPTLTAGNSYWTVSVDGGKLPYNSILNYSIPGTKVTYNNITYTLTKSASTSDIPGSSPTIWATDAALTSDCFRSLSCTSVVGFDGTDYNKSYQTGNTPSYSSIKLKYYDNSNLTVELPNTLVNMGAERNPTAPLALNGNDLLLRGSSDHYHGLGYYGSSGNVADATTPQKRNFADTPIDGPVLYGWAGGALGIRQRQQVDATTGISLEKIALRWDWASVNIGSTALPMNFIVNGTGKVGIGTNSPNATVQIGTDVGNTLHCCGDGRGVIITSNSNGVNDGGRALLELHSPKGINNLIIQSLNDNAFIGTLGPNPKPLSIQQQGGSVVMGDAVAGYICNLLVNGSVGIGTTAIPTAYKLAVGGAIIAEKVSVKMQGQWPVPDYVFAKSYNLPLLKDVECYVKANSHLPEVPSEKEINKDGLDVAQMNIILLKKVEELTLYLIDQNKKIEQQAKDIEMLKRIKQ